MRQAAFPARPKQRKRAEPAKAAVGTVWRECSLFERRRVLHLVTNRRHPNGQTMRRPAVSTPEPASTGRPYSHGELIADAAVHAAAIVAGVIGFSVLFEKIAAHGAFGDAVAMTIYAAGFFLLFGFSCAYNMAPESPAKSLLRRCDHAAIYLMIAGTYTALLSQ